MGLQNGALYAMIAVGYTLVYGVLGLINFAHGDVFMWGGFGAAFLTRGILGSSVATGWATIGLIFAGVAMGGLVSVFVAVSVERVAYRPLRRKHAPKLAFLISAIGASYILETLAGKEFGYGENLFPAQIFPWDRPYSRSSVRRSNPHTHHRGGGLRDLDRGRPTGACDELGRGIRAVAQDSETSSLMGVNIEKTITLTFIVGGALAGAAGFLYSLQSGIEWNSGVELGIYAFTAAVLGGIGNLRGAASVAWSSASSEVLRCHSPSKATPNGWRSTRSSSSSAY